MNPLRIVLRDFYRFHFSRPKHRTVNDLSIWRVPACSLEQRQERLEHLKRWMSHHDHTGPNESAANIAAVADAVIHTADLTETLLRDRDRDQIVRLFTLFNRRKYVPDRIAPNLAPRTNVVNLKTYCNLSRLFLREYEQSGNLQFLNTSLKVTDFLMYCQIISHDTALNGSIAEYFPCYHRSFRQTGETNRRFAENLVSELRALEAL